MWKIWYDDGTSFSSEDGPVEAAPGRGVQVVVQSARECGWQALAGTDYYIWRDGMWWFAVDKFGLFDYLIEPGLKKVLFGRTLTSDEYDAIWQKAMADPDMPPKTNFGRGERKPSPWPSPLGPSPLTPLPEGEGDGRGDS